MQNQIGRLEAHVEHIQFDVTDLRHDVKSVLRHIGNLNAHGRDAQPTEREGRPLKVVLHDFPDLGLIVKAATNVIYTNQTGGIECWHPEVEGFLVPLRTHLGLRELNALRSLCSDCDDGIDSETADELESVLAGFGFKGIRVDRSKLTESWESWIHVILSGELGLDVPLEGPRPERLEAVLTWPNSD
jgi:Family of unknown function (DUF6210)